MQQAQQTTIRKILQPDEVQAKPDIDENDSKYEQEPEYAVADLPVTAISGIPPRGPGASAPIQRSENEEPEEELQRQPDEEEEEPVQTKLIQKQPDNEEEEEEILQAKLIQRQAADTREIRPSRFGYVGPQVKAQQAEIRRILRSTGAQAKLTIGQLNDKYEQEADRVADQVMRMSDADVAQHQPENEEEEEILQSKPLADQITSLVQRQEEPPEEEEEETLQPKPLADQITPLVQRQEEPPEEEEELQAKSKTGETPAVNPSIESRINSFKGGGQALPRDTRTFFESRMGRDFGGVRIHTDNKAADTAQSVRAKAFTLGNNIVFDTSQYSPNNQKGKKLLAHELTHVVQQAGGMSSAGSGNGRSIVMSASSALTLMRDKKAKIPVSPLKCEPEPKTLDEVSKIVGSTDTMGYTKAAPIHLELEIKSEEGKCKLTITAEPRLSFKHLVYTKAGDYKMGTVTIPFKPCKGKVGDLYFRITPKMADKIKQGEIEHCRDNKLAFALSYERYVKAVKKVAAMDFSGKDVSSCQTEVLKHLKAETSIDVSNWKSVADCLFDKTLERDNKKWHAIKIMSGGGIDASKVSKFILDPSCGSLTLELDHTKLLNEVGKHPPKDVVKGCGEKWGKEVEKKIYVSGEMSDRYWQTTPKERSNINEEIDRRFIEETGVTHALDWEDPKDRPLARQWLRIRDEVMGEREASRTATR